MAKKISKSTSPNKNNPSGQSGHTSQQKHTARTVQHKDHETTKNNDYLWSMSYAPRLDEGVHWFQILPISFFAAFVILITQMKSYERPMEDFFWYSGDNHLVDFFSYYKMAAILLCAGIALILLIYRVFTQSLAFKRSPCYIPMLIYSAFVILSYIFSDYKEFALWGWNDRFEGTLTLLAYMVMLFYAINSINTTKAVKMVLYPTAAASALLGLLGVSQAMDKDFFRTVIGQKLITPNVTLATGSTINEMIEEAAAKGEQFLNFTFQNKEIYQTVYNINYVSFYLTLLIPLFGLIFIHSFMKGKEEQVWKKVIWALIFALLIFNLIGSASSGGFLGMAIVVIAAVLLLNKQILTWWKPLAILLTITILMAGATYDRWLPEISSAVKGVAGPVETSVIDEDADTALEAHHLDSILTKENDIIIGVDGNEFTVKTFPDNPIAVQIVDNEGKMLDLAPTNVSPIYYINDTRFDFCLIQPAQSDDGKNFIIFSMDKQEKNWVFRVTDDGVYYNTEIGTTVKLEENVPSVGWADNQEFGSGRGYIWSRTIPMMKDTLLLGHGADTYCLYFPHQDYVGKYNSGTFSDNISIIVDKPHNMYMGMWLGTGMFSVFAFLAIMLLYTLQSVKLYRNRKYFSFLEYSGIGIFLGIVGFAVTGLVNDSSVSIMPMFYGLLGTGTAINMILARNAEALKE